MAYVFDNFDSLVNFMNDNKDVIFSYHITSLSVNDKNELFVHAKIVTLDQYQNRLVAFNISKKDFKKITGTNEINQKSGNKVFRHFSKLLNERGPQREITLVEVKHDNK